MCKNIEEFFLGLFPKNKIKKKIKDKMFFKK